MAVKNYGIHDKWTNINKVNNVEIQSVDGVIENIKVNGEPGGGGDFTTATVTISDINKMGWCFAAPIIALTPTHEFPEAFPYIEHTFFSDAADARTIVLYKGVAIIDIVSDEGGTLSVAGNAVLGNGSIKVTGDCEITVS